MAAKRLQRDIANFYAGEYHKNGIFIHVPEDNMMEIKAMIIGTEGTPYEDGFHFFSLSIPDAYPLEPPRVKYITGDGRTRFNPNLYVTGKVCLSIINTWAGPRWSPIMKLEHVLLSIQSMILTTDPLRNEPGYDCASRATIDAYSDIVEHQNLKVALFGQLMTTPEGFDVFRPRMQEYFIENKDKIRARLKKLLDLKNNARIVTNYSGMHLTTDYRQIMAMFNKATSLSSSSSTDSDRLA